MTRWPIRSAACPASSRGAARQGLRIVEKDEIDVGRIIELAAAELAEREDGEALRRRLRRALGDGGGERRDRAAGRRGPRARRITSSRLSAPARSPMPSASASALRSRRSAVIDVGRRARRPRRSHRAFEVAAGQRRGRVRPLSSRKRRKGECARARAISAPSRCRLPNCFLHATGLLPCPFRLSQRLKPASYTHVKSPL